MEKDCRGFRGYIRCWKLYLSAGLLLKRRRTGQMELDVVNFLQRLRSVWFGTLLPTSNLKKMHTLDSKTSNLKKSHGWDETQWRRKKEEGERERERCKEEARMPPAGCKWPSTCDCRMNAVARLEVANIFPSRFRAPSSCTSSNLTISHPFDISFQDACSMAAISSAAFVQYGAHTHTHMHMLSLSPCPEELALHSRLLSERL